ATPCSPVTTPPSRRPELLSALSSTIVDLPPKYRARARASIRDETGENPSRRACSAERPVIPTPSPNTLSTHVPTTPAKRSRTPAAFAPATRPCLFAVVPSGTYVGRPVTRCCTSAQSPAA